MKIKAVLFDLDDTLVGIPNSYSYFDDIIKLIMENVFNLPVPTRMERDKLWRSGKDHEKVLKSWGLEDPYYFWAEFDEEDFRQRYRLINEEKLELFPDVRPLLDFLNEKSIPMAVVTNAPTKIAEAELKSFEIDHYFDIILGLAEEQAICKPEPDGLIRVINQLNQNFKDKNLKFNSSEALYIGDKMVDFVAATRAGMAFSLIDRKNKLELSELSNNTEENKIVKIKISELKNYKLLKDGLTNQDEDWLKKSPTDIMYIVSKLNSLITLFE